MIPLRDTVRPQRFPLVNTTLIVVNVLVFIMEASLTPEALDRFIINFGLVPATFWSGGPGQWLTLFTSMFLHGSLVHLLSNMLALYIFGDNIEDRLGRGRYLLFYLLGGIAGGLVHVLVYPTSALPTVGASGAIAAVLGGYLILYPTARITTLVPLVFVWIVRIPAVVYLGFWFLSQLFNGSAALAAETFQGGGVAWWAHIGGFVTGMILVRLFGSRQQRQHAPEQYYGIS